MSGFIDDGQVHTLPNGKRYLSIGGRVTYLSPVAFGEPLPGAQGPDFFHGRTQFNQNTGETERPFDPTNLISAGVGATIAAPFLAGAFGAGGAGGAAGGGATAGLGPSTAANIAATTAAAGAVPSGIASAGGGMGLLGTIGKGVGKFLGFDPKDPGTWLGALSDIGRVTSGVGEKRAQGRYDEAGMNNRQDQLRLQASQLLENALMNRAGLDLRQREFALQAPGQRAGNSVRGDILANVQDVGVTGPTIHTGGQVPRITGGLRPSILSGNSRQLGSDMSRQALMDQMRGDTFAPTPAPSIPDVTPMPQAGGVDTFLNTVGGAGLAGGVLENFFRRRQREQMQRPLTDNDELNTHGGFY